MAEPITRHILCVDDDIDTCEVLTTVLQDYKLHLAYTVAQAIKRIDERFFDLYLIDNWLPDGTGLEVCRYIRQHDTNVPVLFLSAAASNNDRRDAMTAGATAYVTKPSDPFELEDLIETLVEQAEVRSTTAKHDEFAAIVEYLCDEQKEVEFNTAASLDRADRLMLSARERFARVAAYLKFTASGGTRSYFESWWPKMWEEASNFTDLRSGTNPYSSRLQTRLSG